LINYITFFNFFYAFSLVFKFGPSIQHHDKLECAMMNVPMLHRVRILLSVRPDDTGNIGSVRCSFDTQVTIIEYFAKTWVSKLQLTETMLPISSGRTERRILTRCSIGTFIIAHSNLSWCWMDGPNLNTREKA
jgi:hypothetical protein